MPTWPSSLPQFALRNGYQEGLAGNSLLITDMDAGRPKRRNRYSADVKPLTIVLSLTSDELDTFETFYETDLARGSLSFDYPHPRKGGTVSVGFRQRPEPVRPDGALTYRLVMQLEVYP